MSIRGTSHIAIGCTDVEKALPFYRDVLGLTVSADFRQDFLPEHGTELHKGRHISRRQVWLHSECGECDMAIALDQLFVGDPEDHRSWVYDLGINHVGLWVDDIETIVERAHKGGYRVIMPHTSPAAMYGEEGDHRIASVFLCDPDGNLIQCDQRVGKEGIQNWRAGGDNIPLERS